MMLIETSITDITLSEQEGSGWDIGVWAKFPS
jgi:hypothetical protein